MAAAAAAAAAAGHVVDSVKAVQELIKTLGEEAFVKVQVSNRIERLCEVKGMNKLLNRKIRQNSWIVDGLHKLRPLLPFETHVDEGYKAVCELASLLHPDVDHAALNLTKAEYGTKIRRLAKNLRDAGYKLRDAGSKLKKVNRKRAKPLAEHMVTVAMDLRKRKRRKSRSLLLADVRAIKTRLHYEFTLATKL